MYKGFRSSVSENWGRDQMHIFYYVITGRNGIKPEAGLPIEVVGFNVCTQRALSK